MSVYGCQVIFPNVRRLILFYTRTNNALISFQELCWQDFNNVDKWRLPPPPPPDTHRIKMLPRCALFSACEETSVILIDRKLKQATSLELFGGGYDGPIHFPVGVRVVKNVAYLQ